MNLSHFEVLVSILGTIVAMLVPTAYAVRWVYRQGGTNREQLIATKANTEATAKLSGALDQFTEKAGEIMSNHEQRITRAEDRLDRLETWNGPTSR